MDRQSNQSETLCEFCNRFIETRRFLIHKERCRNSSSRAGSRRIFQDRPQTRYQRRANQMQQQQKIPCHFCGYAQTLAELDTHPNRCQHREEQCQRCKQKFPKSLMSQHLIVCPSNFRNHEQENEFEDEQHEQIFESQPRNIYHHHHHHHHPQLELIERVFSRNLGVGRMGRMERMRVMQRRPDPPQQRHQQIIMLGSIGQLIRLLAGQGLSQEQQGLSKQEIKKFPVKQFGERKKKEGEEDLCIICYCNFQEEDKFMTLPCQHIFHPQCVGTWLEKNPTCPVCKKNYGQQKSEQGNNGFSGVRRIIFRN